MHQRHLEPISAFHVLLLSLVTFSVPALALEPDQIVLIVNTNVPASRTLAEFYAGQRHIPPNRIIELSLKTSTPTTFSEDITAADYDERVAPVVRNFLKSNALDGKVTCLVTFWGVPLRIGRRPIGIADKQELAELKSQRDAVVLAIKDQIKSAETLAGEVDPGFRAQIDDDVDTLPQRAELALNSILRHIPAMKDLKNRGEAYERMMRLVRDLAGQPEVAEKMSQPALRLIAPKPPADDEIAAARKRAADLQKQVTEINAGPQDSSTRAKLRDIVKAEWGTLNLFRVLVVQINTLDNDQSEAAFDSELALLWWPPYPKAHWAANPLNFQLAGKSGLPAHTLMIMRLDGPSEQSVHALIETSLKIENEGLKGEIVLDARGKPSGEPYGNYDETIRRLAELLRQKTTLKVVLDNKPELIAAHSETDIALYCGWYSLRNYVPPGRFNPGAVGFHIASSEMVSLHNAREKGWCRNLMIDGVVATLGPVAEPYLESFPKADEFFPLLLTGKLTLADVYWKTTPWASWMQCCIGDPLYRPYKIDPPLRPGDLPEKLKVLMR